MLHCLAVEWVSFHLSAVSSYSSIVGKNWSSHNEAFSSQLCPSGFQFHTQLSVSPLNGHHCSQHTQPQWVLSTPPACRAAECPFCLRAPLCVQTHKHTHSVPWCFVSDHVSVCFFTLSSCQLCFDFFFASLSHKCSPAWCVNSGGTWHLAPLAVTCQSSHLINISLLFSSFSFILSSCSRSLIVFPPSPPCRHSTSSPPPTALVRLCPGGTGGASGSQSLWATSVHTPGSHVWTPNSLSRGQPNQSTGGRGRRSGDGPFCRRPKAHND